MIYKYSYILCRFRRKNRYAARREQMIGRHNGPRFYSVLTGLFVAAAVETMRADTFLRKPDRFDQCF